MSLTVKIVYRLYEDHWFPYVHMLPTWVYTHSTPLLIYLAVTLTINASFRHFVSQSIVKSIQLFMRNVCQIYLTDALVAYTPCLPTCSTVETSTTVANIRAYQHIYIHTYPSHPHTYNIHTRIWILSTFLELWNKFASERYTNVVA